MRLAQGIRKWHLTAAALAVAALMLSVMTVESVRWRAHVLLLHAVGEIPGIRFREVVGFMLPGSPQSLAGLIETRNPFAVIRNFRTTSTDLAAGARTFTARCAVCHAPDGSGGAAAPALNGGSFKHGDSDWAMFRTIRDGVPTTAMSPHDLNEDELWRLVAFVRSLGTSSTSLDRSSGDRRPPVPPVTADELVRVDDPADDWLTFSGSYSSRRHSLLTELTPVNVAQLALRWNYEFEGDPGPIQASAIVRDGTLFITAPPSRIVALDAATGRQLWSYDHTLLPATRGNEFGQLANRGVAILGDKVFYGAPDAQLVALDASTGKRLWQSAVEGDPNVYYITSAPLAFGDLVVTGVGTIGGGRASIVAFDAASGRERWRFAAIPSPGEPGNDTWAGNSWRTGGAPTWLTGSYDADLDLLFWGIGNPKPDYDASVRRGDNLYSNSVVALRASTGKLIWHFQFTPADDRDWDANQIPILADYRTGDRPHRRVLWANRNGFYYVLDRETGKFVTAQAFVHQTWTDGLDANGRPRVSASSRSREGSMLFPGNMGGTNWWPPSFDPGLNLVFVPVLEQGMVFFGSIASPPGGRDNAFYTAVRALDARTGNRIWEHRTAPRRVDNKVGGLLSTKAGLVFGSDRRTFFALESRSGAPLWSVQTGGNIIAAPVSYAVDGQQFVVVAAGRNLMAFALPRPSTLSIRPVATDE